MRLRLHRYLSSGFSRAVTPSIFFFYQDPTYANLNCTGHGAGFVTPVARAGLAATVIRKRHRLALSFDEREEISRGLVAKRSIRDIADKLSRAPSTISREIKRHGGAKQYRAAKADTAAWERALRPKHCKLIESPTLCKIIAEKMHQDWSPEQIAGWLKRCYPDNQEMHVSHETIYKTLFIQTRGALKKELQQCLRSGRAVRRSRTSSLKGKGLGSIPNAIPISERPLEAADRAIPGHWEGDLI